MKVSFKVYGNVQGVMFRKTFVLGCKKRGLIAGATNNKTNRNQVLCSVEGEAIAISRLKDDLLDLAELNSWHAKVESLDDCEFVEINSHEVTSENFLSKSWSAGVEFYL